MIGDCVRTRPAHLAQEDARPPRRTLQHAFLLTVTSATIWIAILFLIGFTASYMMLMSWADYSYVMPAGAFGYALLTFLAVVFLHETVSPRRWIGVVLICVGVLVVGLTKPRTTEVIARAAP